MVLVINVDIEVNLVHFGNIIIMMTNRNHVTVCEFIVVYFNLL